MTENRYQAKLIKRLKHDLPGCMVLKQDANYLQGIPDLLILRGEHWAALEVKQNAKAEHQPNQDWYVTQMNAMSFARFIYPENEEDILHELREQFGLEGETCVPKSERILVA